MSADLFAEFASNPPRSHQTSTPSNVSRDTTRQPGSQDPFSFGFVSLRPERPSSPVETWPSLANASNSLPGWAPAPTVVTKTAMNDDDDGWGDFETAEPAVSPAHKSPSFQTSSSLSSPLQDSKPKVRPFRVPTIDLMTNTLVDFGPADMEPQPAPTPAPAPAPVPKPAPKSRFPYKFSMKSAKKPAKQQTSVLFDADDFELQGGDDADEDDDEFGDYAASLRANPPSRSHAAPLVDLLSLDDPLPQPQPSKHRSQDLSQIWGGLGFGATSSRPTIESKGPSLHRHTNSLAGLEFNMTGTTSPTAAAAAAAASPSFSSSFAFGTEKKKKKHESSKSVSSIAIWPSASQDTKTTVKLEKKKKEEEVVMVRDGDDDYDDDDGWGAWDDIPSVEPSAVPDVKSAGAIDHWNWDAGPSQADSAILNDKDPPPTNIPPPSVILSMFPDLLASGNAFFQSMSRQNAAVKQKVLSSPETAKFIEGYILLATTAARVVAGRKHRWHRDKILAKSMSISAAGSKGMKLAGVDKTQSAKEDREVADVVAVWQEQVGRLRSAVTAANAADQTARLKVPELRESMQVSTAKMVPTSPKACIVCGLKRDERIAKVDFEVEDSFGEWWAEHWGHRACKNFWIEHERRIRQR